MQSVQFCSALDYQCRRWEDSCVKNTQETYLADIHTPAGLRAIRLLTVKGAGKTPARKASRDLSIRDAPKIHRPIWPQAGAAGKDGLLV